jgi:hypothetical protein
MNNDPGMTDQSRKDSGRAAIKNLILPAKSVLTFVR